MATPTRKTAKSESLTIRLDPKTRFMLEFVARLRGQTITTVVERAITDAANRAVIDKPDDYGNRPLSWRDFWHVSEGVRALAIAKEDELQPTFDEELRLQFTRNFWPFFYVDRDAITPSVNYVEILWPHIDLLIATFREHADDSFNTTVAMMQKYIERAGLEPPEWPPRTVSRNLDDDLPF